MSTTPRACWLRLAVAWALLAVCVVPFDANAEGPKRVLTLHSFGRDFAPYDTVTSVFRTDLARRSPQPINFVDANLDFSRTPSDAEERTFIEYVRMRFEDAPPDAIVTIGPPAAGFYLKHREELFPGTPLVIAALDERLVRRLPVGPNDAVVAAKVDLPGVIENMLRLLPKTQLIAIVTGSSDLERFWSTELRREVAPFEKRVRFEWFNDLSLAQMQERVARLPPNSAVLFGLLILDGAGIPYERQAALDSLHATSNSPIFGFYESELGSGVMGGPYTSQKIGGEHIATATLSALGFDAPARPRVEVLGFESPVYDARELDRWGIPHKQLPPGSEIRFAPPSIWEEHRMAVLATIAALVIQAALIVALLIQRVERQKAEREAVHLGGRILTAQEEERRRLARELHDDVTQRLAALAIDAAKAQRAVGLSVAGGTMHAIRQHLVKLSEDVHALSYRLHPSVLEDLGLVAALKAECSRIGRQEPIRVDFDSEPIAKASIPINTATCVFRVAQEALRNVVRHANANNVEVSLRARDGGVTLAVHDDGSGLAALPDKAHTSLGLVSMRERVRLVGGSLEIDSRPGHGTSVIAWVPLKETT